MTANTRVSIRPATSADLQTLSYIEQQCFVTDRISQRSFKHWIKSADDLLLIAEAENSVLGYGLVICSRGTRLARLYSLAVLPESRGLGVAKSLLKELEQKASDRKKLFMRLEVAKSNESAIRLYHSLEYRTFGEYHDYYDNHDDALRLQKTIRFRKMDIQSRDVRWFPQSTEFTCGPASLLMAMSALTPEMKPDIPMELEIWREATTIFMTSGHGGCHPLGLAISAHKRGYNAEVFINSTQPLFLDGVRALNKKSILELVHYEFVKEAQSRAIKINYADISQFQIQTWINEGYVVIVLISTYRLDRKKAPHWVTITHMDEDCIYVHDPDVSPEQLPIDCQHMPIALGDFEKMSVFGSQHLRSAIAIKPAGF